MARTKGATELTSFELDQIRVGFKLGLRIHDIARATGRYRDTISKAKKEMLKNGSLDTLPLDRDVIAKMIFGGE